MGFFKSAKFRKFIGEAFAAKQAQQTQQAAPGVNDGFSVLQQAGFDPKRKKSSGFFGDLGRKVTQRRGGSVLGNKQTLG